MVRLKKYIKIVKNEPKMKQSISSVSLFPKLDVTVELNSDDVRHCLRVCFMSEMKIKRATLKKNLGLCVRRRVLCYRGCASSMSKYESF